MTAIQQQLDGFWERQRARALARQERQRCAGSVDRNATFEPGVYELKTPVKSDRLGMRKKQRGEGGSHGPATGNLAKRFKHKTRGVRAALA